MSRKSLLAMYPYIFIKIGSMNIRNMRVEVILFVLVAILYTFLQSTKFEDLIITLVKVMLNMGAQFQTRKLISLWCLAVIFEHSFWNYTAGE